MRSRRDRAISFGILPVVVISGTLLACCSGAFPVDVDLMPFIPSSQQYYDWVPLQAPVNVPAATGTPSQVPLSLPQADFPLGSSSSPLQTGTFASANVKPLSVALSVTLVFTVQPQSNGLDISAAVPLTFSIAPPTESNPWQSKYLIPAGTANVSDGITYSKDIDLPNSMISLVESGAIIVRIRLGQNSATLTNPGGQAVAFQSLRVTVTRLRLVGSAVM